MIVKVLSGTRSYGDGTLASHVLQRLTGTWGDAACAFEGPCRVTVQGLVDLEDARRRSPIESRRMLHFLAEHFDRDLFRAVLRQRLLVSIFQEMLPANLRRQIGRIGDDLFIGSRKLSVSIATLTPVSSLIHFGVNLDARGAPVPAVGLTQLGVGNARFLARRVLEGYRDELAEIERACVKVRAVP